MCNFCKIPIYMKIQKLAMSDCAPATETAELMDKWENKTGMAYVEIPSNYCPVCGSQKRAMCAQCGVNPVEDDEVVNLCKKCIKILTKEALDYISDVESGV